VSSPNTLTITNIVLVSTQPLYNTYQVDFTTDAVFPRNIYFQTYGNVFMGGWSGYQDGGTANTNSIQINVGSMFGALEKLQIKIGTKESNIYDL